MKARFAVALFVCAVAGFAPAPFPKPSRRGSEDSISVRTFQGTWSVASMMSTSKDGKHRPYNWHIGQIRVRDDVWTFIDKNGSESTGYALTIDENKRPAWLDFYDQARKGQGQPRGGGIIRRRGGAVEIIYVFGASNRPVSFEQPPDGQYLLTLKKVR